MTCCLPQGLPPCAVQKLLGAPLLGISLGIQPGHDCPHCSLFLDAAARSTSSSAGAEPLLRAELWLLPYPKAKARLRLEKPQVWLCPTVQFYHATFNAFRTTNWNRGMLQFCLLGISFLPASVFKIPHTLMINTLVAQYEVSSLDDKQLNLHFSYLTCTFKISPYFIMRGIEVLT